MNGILIIPSARLIPAELQGDFGQIPSCMIPFGGAPALSRIIIAAKRQGLRVIIAGHEQIGWIEEFLTHAPDEDVKVFDVGLTHSLGETVLRALELSPWGGVPGRVVVNFGDTLVTDEFLQEDGFFFARPEETYRWTTFSLKEDGRFSDILDKGFEKADTAEAQIFVGVFTFVDGNRLQASLTRAVADDSLNLDPFYAAVRAYYNEAAALPAAREAEKWIDLGHLDTYFASRRLFAMGERAFNSVKVDALRGTLTKRSRNEAKFKDEVQWYLRIPACLSYLAPRVFQHGLTPGDMFIEMEFYGYPPLSDVFLFSRLEIADWRAIFNRLGRIMEDMSQFRTRAGCEEKLQQSLQTMYVEKTVERLQEMYRLGLDQALFKGPLTINGRVCRPLDDIVPRLPKFLESFGLLDAQWFSIIHGDFCLSNILFDRRSRTIRLVDPRGRFGAFDVYGDPRYDLAKLSHCFNGNYDFLVHGLFALQNQAEGTYLLKEFANERHRHIAVEFNAQFLADSPTYRQVRLIESLLFLSMVPLHADRPRSQMAFLLRGLETINCLLDA